MIRHVLVRSWVSRLQVACIAVVFATMGGSRGMDAHAMGAHDGHAAHIIATQAAAPQAADPHAGHHGAVEEQTPEQPSNAIECVCVGPCQGGSAPSIGQSTAHAVAQAEVRDVVVAAPNARLIVHDATSHLLPLPTAPPSHV